MCFNSMFIPTLLLASAVLAHPAEEPRFQGVARQSDTDYLWAGVVLEDGSFHSIVGTVMVPSVPYGPRPDSDTIIWLGIGNDNDNEDSKCNNLVRMGIGITMVDGAPSYTSFVQLYPDEKIPIDEGVFAGDMIRIGVGVSEDQTYATVLMNNFNQGWTFERTLKASHAPLCTSPAEWVMECMYFDGAESPVDLVEFTQVTFTDCLAVGLAVTETYGPQDGRDLQLYGYFGTVLASGSSGMGTVTIQQREEF